MKTSILRLPWKVYDAGTDHGQCGPYSIAVFPSMDGNLLPSGFTIAAGKRREGGIYPPAIGMGGVPREEMEQAFRLMASAPEHALILRLLICNSIRIEHISNDNRNCEVCVNGLRYLCKFDEFGCPILGDHLRQLLHTIGEAL